jgi:hypothetical protein
VTYPRGGCAGPVKDLKRVIAIASWQDGGPDPLRTSGDPCGVRRQGLTGTEVRGAPTGVESLDLESPPGDVADARCIEHQLRNLGAEDRYDWEVEAVDDGLLGAGPGNSLRAGDWYATGYLEYPAVESRAGEPPTEGEMTMAGGVPRPASDEIVEPGDTATFTVCYEPCLHGRPGR